jgi:thioredoxin 1
VNSLPEVLHQTFESQVLKSPIPVLVDFGSKTCAPCRAIDPLLWMLAKAHEGVIKIVHVSVDENRELVQLYRVKTSPTLLMFKNGVVVDEIRGATGRFKIQEMIRKVL